MKQFTSKNQKIGEIGEDLACKYLINNYFLIKERNYTKKSGEIDIIATKNGKIYFFEVKTLNVSCENFNDEKYLNKTSENIHNKKLARFVKTLEIYILENNVSRETGFQIDALLVLLDLGKQKAKIKRLENINIF